MLGNAMQYNAMQCNAIQCSTPQHNNTTAQHSIAQHSTAQHSTAQHSYDYIVYINLLVVRASHVMCINPFEPEFTIVISSTTSRELLSQFSTCSGGRWFDVGGKLKKIAMYW